MANEISKLREYDLEVVSRKTKIPLEYLEWMVGGEYAKLRNINVKAYAKIIAREYGLDMDGFLEDFKAFLDNAGQDEQAEKILVNPRLQGYVAKEKKGSFMWLVLLLILIAVGVWGFKFVQDFDFSQFNIVTQNNASTNKAQDDSIIQIKDETEQVIVKEEPLVIIDTNTSASDANATEQDKQESAVSQEEPKSEQTAQSALFTPSKNLWVGIKNLSDMSKRSFSTKEPFDVNLSGDRLVVTGHGQLRLSYGEHNESYNLKEALRFHIKDGQIKKLEYDEYIKLNKGQAW